MALLLSNARVVHGDPAVAPRFADVLIRDGRIAAVGAHGTLDAGDAEVLDLTGTRSGGLTRFSGLTLDGVVRIEVTDSVGNTGALDL